jgi:hypothetical protein
MIKFSYIVLFLILYYIHPSAAQSVSAVDKNQKSELKNLSPTDLVEGDFKLPNVVPPLDYEDDQALLTNATEYIPVQDISFVEEVREGLTADEEEEVGQRFGLLPQVTGVHFKPALNADQITSVIKRGDDFWIGTRKGLYKHPGNSMSATRLEQYGIHGPLATEVTSLAVDSRGDLYVGTPIGLSIRDSRGEWKSIQGKQGLPIEHITALAVDNNDRIWIGTPKGAILFIPYKKGRQWYYRAGKRYLINDAINEIYIAPKGYPVYFNTNQGISKIAGIRRTLAEKADIIEDRIGKWHRRLGLVAACILDDAENPRSYTIPDNDNDGLWTSYHVVAMSLAYGTTGEKKYLESAKEGMHALIMLQNASGIPGLVARSVLPIEERANKGPQWRNTPDGKMLWKSDTSSDEIDGHFFAFYAYWQHIARHDRDESDLIQNQTKTLIDYIVDNNYQLIDWDGERTRWGFWNPENLNDNPTHYIENGLNAAQILSFLKV